MRLDWLSNNLYMLYHPLYNEGILLYKSEEPAHPACVWSTYADKGAGFRDLGRCIAYTDRMVRLADEIARDRLSRERETESSIDW